MATLNEGLLGETARENRITLFIPDDTVWDVADEIERLLESESVSGQWDSESYAPTIETEEGVWFCPMEIVATDSSADALVRAKFANWLTEPTAKAKPKRGRRK